MLEEEFVEVNIGSNKKYYESLGYSIPKYKDKKGRMSVRKGTKILVKVEDVPKSTNLVRFKVKCDYCGEIYYPTSVNYFNGHKIINKDSCDKCKFIKQQEVFKVKYGTNSIKIRSELEGFKVGRNKVQFDIVYQEFLTKGLILQISENEYVDVKTPISFICSNHKEKGIQYKSYDALKYSTFCCKYGAIEGRSGENSPTWKGGISSERDKTKISPEYKQWRLEVYKRDNFTCQCCGDNSGGNLSAHHKENFSSNENLRLDVDNGITLCNSCHNPNQYGSFHNVYGTHNNTPEQLDEYIQRYKNGDFDDLRNKNISQAV